MEFKSFLKLITCCLVLLTLHSACNSDSEINYGSLSPDAQIKSFSVDVRLANGMDSLAYPNYPAIKNTKFSIINDGIYSIFNTDSLPQHTEIKTLMVTMEFNTTSYGVSLVYKDKNGADSIPETAWSSTDSVKFIFDKKSKTHYPRINVTAPNGDVRQYTVTFNIHQTDPDSIRWVKMDNFDLPVTGDNKTIMNSDSTKFYSLTNDGQSVYFHSGNVVEKNPTWIDNNKTNLPNSVKVKSLQLIGGSLVVLDENGAIYTTKENNPTSWTKFDRNHILAILGKTPTLEGKTPENNLLVLAKINEKSILAKVSAGDLNNITTLSIKGSGDNTVSDRFPKDNFSALSGEIVGLGQNHMIITSANKQDNSVAMVGRTWLIKAIDTNTLDVKEGYKDNLAEYNFGLTTFAYNKKVYMMANDSLYTSINYGDSWAKAHIKQQFEEKMISEGKNTPSVLVDKNNFVWIFGGKYRRSSAGYSSDVWRGRLNELTYKKD